MGHSSSQIAATVVIRGLAAAILVLTMLVVGVLVVTHAFSEPEAMACDDACVPEPSSRSSLEGEAALPGSAEAERGADGEGEGENTPDLCAAVPEMLQYPEMPSGCEVYSLAAVLRSLGFEANPAVIVAEDLPFAPVGGDPATAYVGDPYVSGGGLPPAIVIAGNSCLEKTGSAARLVDATGSSFDELEAIANGGTPVLMWVTTALQDPGFDAPLESYTFYFPLHCLVVLGSGGGTVATMDPMVGYASYDRDWFRYVYEQCGSMAVALKA